MEKRTSPDSSEMIYFNAVRCWLETFWCHSGDWSMVSNLGLFCFTPGTLENGGELSKYDLQIFWIIRLWSTYLSFVFEKTSCCYNPVWSDLFNGSTNKFLLKVLSTKRFVIQYQKQSTLKFYSVWLYCFSNSVLNNFKTVFFERFFEQSRASRHTLEVELS